MLRNAAFATEVRGFGDIERLAPESIRPGVRFLAYVELVSWPFVPAGGGRFVANARLTMRIEDASGATVWKDGPFPATHEDDSPIGELFIARRAKLPAGLAPGNYQLAIEAIDVASRVSSAFRMPFAVADEPKPIPVPKPAAEPEPTPAPKAVPAPAAKEPAPAPKPEPVPEPAPTPAPAPSPEPTPAPAPKPETAPQPEPAPAPAPATAPTPAPAPVAPAPKPAPVPVKTPAGPPALRNLAFAAKVRGYGDIDPMNAGALRAGDRFLLYVELLNWPFLPGIGGRVTAHARYSLAIVDGNGNQIWRDGPFDAVHTADGAVDDLFVTRIVRLPRTIPAGDYRLSVDAIEVSSGASTSFAIPFTVVPSTAAPAKR